MAYKNKKKQTSHIRALHRPDKLRHKHIKKRIDEDAFIDEIQEKIKFKDPVIYKKNQ